MYEFQEHNFKTIVTDPTVMTPTTLEKIFSFFYFDESKDDNTIATTQLEDISNIYKKI
jgi:hypothetical protein